MPMRKCIFRCQTDEPLFKLPNNDSVLKKWLDFIFGCNSQIKKHVFICASHFTDDCFLNKKEYNSGLISRLSLKEDAVPTIRRAPTPPPPVQASPATTSYALGNTTTSFIRTKSVSTQLSAGTLRSQHYRSKAVQATVELSSRGIGTELSLPQFSSTSAKKRPRLELEEEEGDDVTMSAPGSQDSTHEPEDTITDLSDQIDTGSEFEEAKFIVFESALKELFENCPVCKRHCIVEQSRLGTFVAFKQDCPHCSFTRRWQSQPMRGKVPQGNLELSAAVYFNGGSFSKFERICNTINLKVHNYTTFKSHAHNLLEPAIYHKWTVDQDKVLEEMKSKGKIAVTGDMSVDSPGQSAKFGSYTIMECENNKVLDIQLVQSNEVGGSVNMEKEGLKRSLDLLESKSVQLDYIVTNKHLQVQKHLSEREVTHYYDVQNVVRVVSKKMERLAKQKGCEVLKKWVPGIKSHMCWTAYSSTTGPEKVAKWKSVVNHIQNVHEHDDPLFPKCLHPIRASTNPNKWFKPGTLALHKIEKMLLNRKLLRDVYRLSSNQHASSFESFHMLVRRFIPKNVTFPFIGKLCRLYLAAMHHNENSKPEQAAANGNRMWKLLFPKSSKGRAARRRVKTNATYAYRSDLMRLVFNMVVLDPLKFQRELKKVSVPPNPCRTSDMAATEDDPDVNI